MLVWEHFVGLTFLPFFSGGEGRGEEKRRALNVVRKSPVWKRHDFDFAQLYSGLF